MYVITSSKLLLLKLTSRGTGYNALRFEPGKDNLFSMRDDDAHMKLRSKMAAGVSLEICN